MSHSNDIDFVSSQVKVSVIVPVYQVEEYIVHCLESLSAQAMKNVEFIIVIDGSTDGSAAICEKYAHKDSRFRIFTKQHGGLSSARNYGIDRAKGEYIMFVDSDDRVRPDFCLTAYNCAVNNNSDLVIFCYQRVNSAYDSSCVRRTDIVEGHKTWQEAVELILGDVGVYAWNKIYKRTLFEGIRYPESRFFEDQPVTWRLIHKASNVYFTNEVLYFYLLRKDSITHQLTYEAIKDLFEMKMLFYDGLIEKGYASERLSASIANVALIYAMYVKAMPNDSNGLRAHEILNSYKKIPKGLRWKYKVMMFLFKKSKHLFNFCCGLMGKRIAIPMDTVSSFT